MDALQILVIAAATHAVVDVWFNGELFSGARRWVEDYLASVNPVAETMCDKHKIPCDWCKLGGLCTACLRKACRVYLNMLGRFVLQASTCAYCFSFHVATWAVFVWYILPITHMFFYALAVERLVFAVDQALPARMQFGRATWFEQLDKETTTEAAEAFESALAAQRARETNGTPKDSDSE